MQYACWQALEQPTHNIVTKSMHVCMTIDKPHLPNDNRPRLLGEVTHCTGCVLANTRPACILKKHITHLQDCASPEEPIGNSCTCHKVKVTSSSYLKSDTMHEAYSRSIVLQASQHRKQGDSGSSCLTICKRGGGGGGGAPAGTIRGRGTNECPIRGALQSRVRHRNPHD